MELLNTSVRLVYSKGRDSSWEELANTLQLFFDDIKFVPIDATRENPVIVGNVIFTDDSSYFKYALSYSVDVFYVPTSQLRAIFASLLRRAAFSFLTPEAIEKRRRDEQASGE